MPRPIQATIHSAALRHNLARLRAAAPGRSKPSKAVDRRGPTNWPPSSTPRMIEPIVNPSIQPLALTSCDGGSNSVRMPYLAGE